MAETTRYVRDEYPAWMAARIQSAPLPDPRRVIGEFVDRVDQAKRRLAELAGLFVSLEEMAFWQARQRRMERHYDRVSRPRCPRSARWRACTKHTSRHTLKSDKLTEMRLWTYRRMALGWGSLVLWGGRTVRPDLAASVSIYDGGTNHRVPSGPRRAASKAYRASLAAAAR